MFKKEMQILPEKDQNRSTARLASEFTSTELQNDGGFIGLSDFEMHQAQLAYYHGFIATYMPNAAIYPHMVGMTPERVPLPLECEESCPIYVNAKQYHAILKRRKIRAKFEAQNKLATSRKPYIHKSRHLHALKRARGSGGRFLNTKTVQHSKSHQQLGENLAHGEFQHSESSSWETSAPSISDVTSIFSGDEVFQQKEGKVPSSAFHIGATIPLEQGFALGRTSNV